MRYTLCGVVILLFAGSVYAELQNVQVGGQIEIRGRWYHNAFETGNGPAARPTAQTRLTPAQVPYRATGQAGVLSLFRYSKWGNDYHFNELATSLNVSADFTDNVSAFIELFDFAVWGEDFRSNYVTGVDGRAATGDDTEILQSYIEIKDVLGEPLRLRIGRQVIQYGKDLGCFLLAGKTTPTQRFSYDGVRATYQPTDKLTIDGWWMKLREASPLEEDGDTDFYGVWANYAFGDPLNLSLFWLYLRDARKINDTNGMWVSEQLEDIFGWDDYDPASFHTVGFEASGKYANFDYSAHVAYQFGDAGQLGSLFKKPLWGLGNALYGDDGAKYDHWGMDATIGYTIESQWNFRPFIQGVWYEGEDNRDISFIDWLNPFSRPKASVSFNRLFSDINYCPVVNDNGDLSNFYQLGGGISMTPSEKLSVTLRAYNVWADSTFDWPAYINVPRTRWWNPTGRMLIAPVFSFWDEDSSNNLGFTVDSIFKYTYSKNLSMLFYYGHLFPGDGVRDGAYISYYGTMMNGGLDKEGADYVFWWTTLKF